MNFKDHILLFILVLNSVSVFSQSCLMDNFDQKVINTANSLKEIAQKELLKNECDKYFKEYKERSDNKPSLSDKLYNQSKVLCGKWIFLNLGMRTNVGIPVKVIKVIEKFNGVGSQMKDLGFLTDNSWKDEAYPFGVVPVKHEKQFALKRIASNNIVQMSCAACHTGQLPDGRFSIGATNENLDYGRFNLYAMFSLWMTDKRKNDPTRWLPEIIELYKKLEKENESSFLDQLKMVETIPLNGDFIKYAIGEEPSPLETQKSFLQGQRGIYNGFAPSINFKDRQIYLSSPQLYEAGKYSEAHYGSLAGLESLDDFISEALVYTNRSTRYNNKMYIDPIKEFITCLKSPHNLSPKNDEAIARGKEIFKNKCMSCHDLPDGGGSKTQDFAIMGAPETYLNLFASYKPTEIQSEVTFKFLTSLGLTGSVEELKVRRLNGIWTRKNLTSNGQIKGLDHLFCLNQQRVLTHNKDPKTQGIHYDLCTDYQEDEKRDLIETLNHWY
jgi:cytochrome c5